MRGSRLAIAIHSLNNLHQFLFFLGGQLFDLPFSAHGLFFCGKTFVVDQFHRPPAFGVFGASAAVVVPDSFFQVVGPSGVQRAVPTFYNICVIHTSYMYRRPGPFSQPGSPIIYVKQSAKVVYHIFVAALRALQPPSGFPVLKRLRIFNMARYFLYYTSFF